MINSLRLSYQRIKGLLWIIVFVLFCFLVYNHTSTHWTSAKAEHKGRCSQWGVTAYGLGYCPIISRTHSNHLTFFYSIHFLSNVNLPTNHQQETESLAKEIVGDVIAKPELSEPGPQSSYFYDNIKFISILISSNITQKTRSIVYLETERTTSCET